MDKVKNLLLHLRFRVSIFMLRRMFKKHGVPKIYAHNKKDKKYEKFMSEYLEWTYKNG